VSITCATAASITIENLRVSSPTTTSGNIINFASSTSNSLVLTGTNLMENDNYSLNGAVIHVPSDSTLNISGSGTLYLYKNSMGAGIGSNANEASGVINFNHTGTILAKGSKTGPTIGGDTGVGNITINSGILNVETNARGAGIGGSNQCNGGVVSITGGNVYVTCDFSGHAIGSGASASNGGTLYISGGSLQTRHTGNSPLTDSTIINAAIRYGTPSSYSTSGSAYTLDLAGTSFENGEFTVTTGSSTATTQVNHWYYTPSTTSTMANWSYITSGTNYNSTVTLYVPSGTTYVTLSKTSGASSVYVLEDTTWTSAVTRSSSNSDYLFHVATGKVLTLGSGASITGNSTNVDVYLDNTTNASDTYIVLTTALSNDLVVECSNPTAGNYGTGTTIAQGASSVITTATTSHIIYDGYTIDRSSVYSGLRYIFISGEVTS